MALPLFGHLFGRFLPSVRRHSAAVMAVGRWRQALGLWEAPFAAENALGVAGWFVNLSRVFCTETCSLKQRIMIVVICF